MKIPSNEVKLDRFIQGVLLIPKTTNLWIKQIVQENLLNSYNQSVLEKGLIHTTVSREELNRILQGDQKTINTLAEKTLISSTT